MESEIIRELFDTANGGPARAFECLLPNWVRGGVRMGKPCGAICRTLRGMRSHQLAVHTFKPQMSIPLNGTEERDDVR